MNRPFPVGARVKRKKPPPGVVVGYLLTEKPGDDARVAVRWDGSDIVMFFPATMLELEEKPNE